MKVLMLITVILRLSVKNMIIISCHTNGFDIVIS